MQVNFHKMSGIL